MSIFNTRSNLNLTRYKAAGKPILGNSWFTAVADFIATRFTTETAMNVDTISEATDDTGVTIDGVLIKDGTVTTTAPSVSSVDPAVTATGVANTDAFQLTEEFNVITGGAANTGVLLPASAVGLTITVVNLTASTKVVYPPLLSRIDDLAISTGGVTIQPEDVVTFICYTTLLWQSDFETVDSYNSLSVNNALTTGASLAVTDTGVYTGTGVVNVTAAGATSGTLVNITGVGLTTGKGLSITTDAITTGDMLYLDNGNATMTGDGKFINCNDDDVSVFSVAAGGDSIWLLGAAANVNIDAATVVHTEAVPVLNIDLQLGTTVTNNAVDIAVTQGAGGM